MAGGGNKGNERGREREGEGGEGEEHRGEGDVEKSIEWFSFFLPLRGALPTSPFSTRDRRQCCVSSDSRIGKAKQGKGWKWGSLVLLAEEENLLKTARSKFFAFSRLVLSAGVARHEAGTLSARE